MIGFTGKGGIIVPVTGFLCEDLMNASFVFEAPTETECDNSGWLITGFLYVFVSGLDSALSGNLVQYPWIGMFISFSSSHHGIRLGRCPKSLACFHAYCGTTRFSAQKMLVSRQIRDIETRRSRFEA